MGWGLKSLRAAFTAENGGAVEMLPLPVGDSPVQVVKKQALMGK